MSQAVSFENGDNFIRNLVTVRGCWGEVTAPIRRMTESPELCVDVDDVMEDLRVDSPEDERATYERFIRTACAYLERRTCAVCLRGEFEVLLPGWWTGPLELRRFPLREIVGLSYLSAANTWTDVDLADFYSELHPASFSLEPLQGWTQPQLWSQVGRVRLRFEAGFDDFIGSGGTSVDPQHPILEPWRGLITGLVGHYAENRELMQAERIAEVEMGAASLLASVRQFW